MGLLGLILIVLGVKFSIQFTQGEAARLDLNGQPMILFFSLDASCECIRQMIHAADFQIAHWSEEARQGVVVNRYDFDQNRQLANQYGVYRVPSLILLDGRGRVVSRQDDPLLKNGPLDLKMFEAAIQTLMNPE